MNIAEGVAKSKELLGRIPTELLYVLVLILVAIISFELGILAERESKEGAGFSIEYPKGLEASAASAVVAGEGKYVASEKGTKYHLPTCSGAKTISEENKIWFASKEEAEARGYTPAGNCKGI